jgi:glycosyltransferase involved in cell wall biosynthesis
VTRLVLIAPTSDGEDVGEAWSTHQWVRLLGSRHDVTLLTYHKRGRTPARQQLSDLPIRVVEWMEPPLVGRAERLNSMLKPGYVPFYRKARRWLKMALAAGEQFDLVHQLAPLALRYPSPGIGLGLPCVIGPVGGSLDSPPAFAAEEGGAPWFVGLRGLDEWRLKHDRLLRRTFEDADCVIGIADYVRDLLDTMAVRRFEFMSDTGVNQLQPVIDRSANRGPLRLLFVGRLIRTKGVRDAVRAMSLIPDVAAELDVVGDGYDRAACEDLARELGVTARVRFHGRLDRSEVDDFYRSADVFFFPSYREPGGIVVSEAMAFGLPLVVCARGGPATTVNDKCGIRVAATDPGQYARDLAAAVRRLADDPQLRQSMGDAARRRIGEIGLWDNKIERIEKIYAEVIATHAR